MFFSSVVLCLCLNTLNDSYVVKIASFSERVIHFPSLAGNSFILIDINDLMQSSMVDLTLSVKTTQKNATILFVHGTNPSNNTEDIAAYLELFIINGLIGYRFSCDGVLNETLTTNAFVATGDEYRIRIR